jgi:predicted nucleic acid-binding protein
LRVALDTNVLACADGVNGAAMRNRALELPVRLSIGSVVVPAQAPVELFNLLVRKDKQTATSARETVLRGRERFSVVETSGDVIASALDLAIRHRLSIWDSIVLSSAAEAGCALFASDDLRDGFSWRGVTVANPLSRQKNELLGRALGEP